MSPCAKKFVVFTVLLGGCGAATKPYVAPRVDLPDSNDQIFAAVEHHVRDQDWTTVEKDARGGRLIALAPVHTLFGVPTRERWTFVVADGGLKAAMRFEARYDDGPGAKWHSSERVCSGYQYLREKDQLERITQFLVNPPRLARR